MVDVYRDIDGRITKIGDEHFGEFFPIYNNKLPGHAPCDTSRQAAVEALKFAGGLQQRVFDAIKDAGAFGLTVFEIMAELDGIKDSIAPRVTELSALGLVVDSNFRRKSPSGRQAIVWVHKDFLQSK